MNDIQKKALQSAMRMLDSIQAKYAIVVGDEKFGGLSVVLPKSPKSNQCPYPRNELRTYLKPFVDVLNEGDVGCIPLNGYEPKWLAQAVATYAGQIWGPGTYTTCTTEEDVQILRFVPEQEPVSTQEVLI